MKVNLNNVEGIKKTINKDGRILIPFEYRKSLGINFNEEVNIYLLENGIFIKKGE